MHIDADIWSVKQSTPLHWMKGLTGANVLLSQYFWGISISHTFLIRIWKTPKIVGNDRVIVS